MHEAVNKKIALFPFFGAIKLGKRNGRKQKVKEVKERLREKNLSLVKVFFAERKVFRR